MNFAPNETQFKQIVKTLSNEELAKLLLIYEMQLENVEDYETKRHQIATLAEGRIVKFLSLGLCAREKSHLIPRVARNSILKLRADYLSNVVSSADQNCAHRREPTISFRSYDEILLELRQIPDVTQWNTARICDYIDKYYGKNDEVPLANLMYTNRSKPKLHALRPLLKQHRYRYKISSYAKYLDFTWVGKQLYVKWKPTNVVPSTGPNVRNIYNEDYADRFIKLNNLPALITHLSKNHPHPPPRRYLSLWQLPTAQLLEYVSIYM
jgi:hypothetical protein